MQDASQRIAKVILPRRVWEGYDYLVPADMPMPRIGERVLVPLRSQNAVGVVIDHPTQSDFNLKPINRVVDEVPLISEDLVKLGLWMSSYYHHPLGSVFETMLPKKLTEGRPINLEGEKRWELVDPNSKPKIRPNAHRQQDAWQAIHERGFVNNSELQGLGIERATLAALEKNQIVRSRVVVPKLTISPSDLVPTDEQQACINAIRGHLDEFRAFLLDGITGSGKTEVYLRLIEEVISRGKQALMLVPEIAITPQMMNRFKERFSSVGVFHSMVSGASRFETWVKVATGKIPLVIGTRSAVFLPFKNLGLIVVDEEHDASYKQFESLRYSARDTAVYRANYSKVPCILGSATPSLESIVNVRNGRYHLLRLSHRPGTAELPTFHIQDMRNTRVEGGICEPLLTRIGEHLSREGQVLVLLNRRGYSTKYFCKHCGWTAFCDDCDVALTWHQEPRNTLSCHHCGRRYLPVRTCPDCGNEDILMTGVGTQQVEEQLSKHFPDVPHVRIDRDNIKTNRQMNQAFNQLQVTTEGLLIGTQMLAKGHHFPNVTLVAVLAADNGFLATDFKGAERTAQLIVQVAGRAGRAEKRGEVWIQTYNPENEDLQSLVVNGYAGFASTELEIRKEGQFPPFGQLAVIRAESSEESLAETFCEEVLDVLRGCQDVAVLGPASAPITRVAKQYRFQGIVIAENRKSLHQALSMVERKSPTSRKVRWSIDVDPVEMS